ncbi:MAG: hypothetical protein AAGA29_14150 [Planctomycetota bacterium]
MPREDNITKTPRLAVWGNSMLNKLPAQSRRRRKRLASKRRRAILKVRRTSDR